MKWVALGLMGTLGVIAVGGFLWALEAWHDVLNGGMPTSGRGLGRLYRDRPYRRPE